MPPKTASKRKSVGDIPSEREKKVRANDDAAPTIEEQRQRAKEWHSKRKSLSPAPSSRRKSIGVTSPNSRPKSVSKGTAQLENDVAVAPASRRRSSGGSNAKENRAQSPPPMRSPQQTRLKRETKRRQTVEGVVKARTPRRQSQPLATTMADTGFYGFRTIEERLNSKCVGLAPKSHLDSISHLDSRDATEQGGPVLASVIFICLSFGVVFASLFYTDNSKCLFSCLGKHMEATLIPLQALSQEEYCTATMFGVGVGVLSYFLLGGDPHDKPLQY